ncbi:MAG TPA: extracellular solute-binding protein, partial [Chloroflexia bacterium]|nr:extracellular solute-binding protein [Chloroflexia bacterium]
FLHNPQAGATISGSWLFLAARGQASGELAAQLGVTTPPGPSFVGGSHLVIWQHTRQREAALQLVRFLTSVPAQVRYCEAMGLLPVTAEAQASPPFSTDPLWQQTIRAAQTGRSFPVTRTWGLMEYRLVAGLNALWAETMANPAGDIDAAIRRHLDPLAVRLEQLIGQG